MNARARSLEPRAGLAIGLVYGALALFVYVVPARAGVIDTPMPWLALIPIFFWGSCRPGAWESTATFVLGVAHDWLTGGPLGPFTLGFLAAYAVAAMEREALAGQSAAAAWIGFGAAAGAAGLAAWGGALLALGASPDMGALFWQIAVTVLLAPLAARPLGGFARVGAAGLGAGAEP